MLHLLSKFCCDLTACLLVGQLSGSSNISLLQILDQCLIQHLLLSTCSRRSPGQCTTYHPNGTTQPATGWHQAALCVGTAAMGGWGSQPPGAPGPQLPCTCHAPAIWLDGWQPNGRGCAPICQVCRLRRLVTKLLPSWRVPFVGLQLVHVHCTQVQIFTHDMVPTMQVEHQQHLGPAWQCRHSHEAAAV